MWHDDLWWGSNIMFSFVVFIYHSPCRIASRGLENFWNRKILRCMKISLLSRFGISVCLSSLLCLSFPRHFFSSFFFLLCFVNSPKRKREDWTCYACLCAAADFYVHIFFNPSTSVVCVLLLCWYSLVRLIFFLLVYFLYFVSFFFFSSCDIFTAHEIFFRKKRKQNTT